jgi:hypothetical protein
VFEVIRENGSLVSHLAAGSFARSYAVFVMDVVLSILDELNGIDSSGLGYGTTTVSLLASITSVGSIAGMLFLGLLETLSAAVLE